MAAGVLPDVFKGKKPDDFVGECIVINALPITKDQLQVCRVNVNIYVPNLEQDRLVEGEIKKDRSQPNFPRLKELTIQVDDLFEDYDTDEYSIRVEDEYMIENDGFAEHYNNIRTVFRNINI
ncbi:hypothetical protein D7004_17935 [Pedobacter jejuensis]|uniref:Uncharacterized protein n=2 Tax=Pedobacter jejuensis TaxID=1268550 RepID=A0A3N0BPN6_9SPHI|nr:hypothetical protein D7004_17935 [Pedobacter jejuensis]